MSKAKRLNRRDFLKATAMTAAGVLAVSCATPTADVIEKEVTVEKVVKETVVVEKEVEKEVTKVVKETVVVEKAVTATPLPSAYQGAPELASLVEAGTLPPVDERLPQTPMVFEGPDGVGTYGGQFNGVELVGQGPVIIDCMVGYETLVNYNNGWEMIPDVAEGFEMNEDASEYTFHIRKGIRWSDGEPFTADDILFRWEDVAMDPEVSPTPPNWGITDILKMDDYTVKFVLEKTNVQFLADQIAHPGGMNWCAYPEHHCKQFHQKYNSKAQDMAKDAGLERWQELLARNYGVFSNSYVRQQPGMPVMAAWMGGDQEVTPATTQFEMPRNPYFWKVDPDGKQYPYIGSVQFKYVQNVETALLEAAAGNVTYQRYHVHGLANRAFHIENMEKANYHIQDIKDSWANSIAIYVNLTPMDPALAPIHKDKNFHIGLSHAINRQEMIDTLYLGMLTPRQVAPTDDSPYRNEQLATQYLEYDVALANEYLDKVMPDKDGDGWRLRPDGEQYMMVFIANDRQNYRDLVEMFTRYWQEVGVRTEMRLMDRTTWNDAMAEYEWGASIWSALGGFDPTLAPQDYVPGRMDRIGGRWWRWSMNPDDERAEEPPDVVKEQTERFEKTLVTVDPDERKALWDEILQVAADEFWVMGLSSPEVDYYIVNNDLRNVPEMFFDWVHGLYGPTYPWSFFFAT
jgi:peptide/nickel transport system substrate-binding protein